MVVDLPAPFGPTKPVTWPGSTVNVMPSSASVGPNRLRSPATSIVASMVDQARDRPAAGGRHAAERSSRCRSADRTGAWSPCEGYGGHTRRGGRGRSGLRRQWDGRWNWLWRLDGPGGGIAGRRSALAAGRRAARAGRGRPGDRPGASATAVAGRHRRPAAPPWTRCWRSACSRWPPRCRCRSSGRSRRRWRSPRQRVLALVAFGQLTAAGLIAQLIAGYWLGWTAGFGLRRGGRRRGRGRRRRRRPPRAAAQLVVAALAAAVPGDRAGLPRRRGGGAARRGRARRGGAAIAGRARAEEARTRSAARRGAGGHADWRTPRAASGPASPASCTTWSRTTSR